MNNRLANALKFTDDDLIANRSGRISAAQRKPYAVPPVNRIAVYVILGHALLLVGILGAVAVIANQPVMWGVLGIVGVMSLMPFFLTRSEFLSRPVVQDDINRGKAASVCGIVQLPMQDKRYHLIVGTYEFRNVTLRVWGAFRPGVEYCVYYLPRSGVILSAEEIQST